MSIKILQWFNVPEIPKRYADAMNKVRAIVENNGADYELKIGRPDYLKEMKPSWFYDSLIIRIRELGENPELFWLDSDCEINGKLFTFKYKPGKPYILEAKCPSSAMYCNGQTQVFKEMLKAFIPFKGCLCRQYLYKNRNEFEYFEKDMIKHNHFAGRG